MARVKLWRGLSLAQRVSRWAALYRCLGRLTPHERRHHFNMATWGEKNECGTSACAAGFGSLDPTLRRMGFKGTFDKNGNLNFNVDPSRFFGDVGNSEIFCGIDGGVGAVRKEIRSFISRLKKKETTGDSLQDEIMEEKLAGEIRDKEEAEYNRIQAIEDRKYLAEQRKKEREERKREKELLRGGTVAAIEGPKDEKESGDGS